MTCDIPACVVLLWVGLCCLYHHLLTLLIYWITLRLESYQLRSCWFYCVFEMFSVSHGIVYWAETSWRVGSISLFYMFVTWHMTHVHQLFTTYLITLCFVPRDIKITCFVYINSWVVDILGEHCICTLYFFCILGDN